MTTQLSAPKGDKPAREPRIGKKVCHALDLWISGRANSRTDAAKQAGISREHFCRELKKPHVQGRLDAEVQRFLSTSKAPAAATLLRLMRESSSDHVKKDCATSVLGFSGITVSKDRAPIVQIGVSVGYVIDLTGNDRRTDPVTIQVTPGAAEQPSSTSPAPSRGYVK